MNNNNDWGGSWGDPVPPVQDEFHIPLEVKVVLSQNNYPLNRDGILMLWQKAKADLEQAKIFEMDIRKLAVKATFDKPKEGMNTVALGETHEAKAVIKYNYNLADNDTVEACLDEISKMGNEGSFIADRLVSWKPSFLLTEYRQLQDEKEKGNQAAIKILNIVDKMLTITDGIPTLEIKEKRKKK